MWFTFHSAQMKTKMRVTFTIAINRYEGGHAAHTHTDSRVLDSSKPLARRGDSGWPRPANPCCPSGGHNTETISLPSQTDACLSDRKPFQRSLKTDRTLLDAPTARLLEDV